MEQSVTVSAPINIALIKYWGKKDELNIIPMNDSISLTLDQNNLNSTTFLRATSNIPDSTILLNDKEGVISSRMKSVFAYAIARANIDTDIKEKIKFEIKSMNNFPTAAGMASSASGMAALAFALGQVFELSDKDVSVMARLGSGSATRSVFGGIVKWYQVDGESRSVQLYPPEYWPELRVLICVVARDQKRVSSTAGMQTSVATSQLITYRYSHSVHENIRQMIQALHHKDFASLAAVTMRESNQLHAVCLDTTPPIVYLNTASFAIIDFVNAFNAGLGSLRLAYTFDAGPNAFLVYEEKDEELLRYCLHYSFQAPDVGDLAAGLDGGDCAFQLLRDSLPRSSNVIESVIATKIGHGPRLNTSNSPF